MSGEIKVNEGGLKLIGRPAIRRYDANHVSVYQQGITAGVYSRRGDAFRPGHNGYICVDPEEADELRLVIHIPSEMKNVAVLHRQMAKDGKSDTYAYLPVDANDDTEFTVKPRIKTTKRMVYGEEVVTKRVYTTWPDNQVHIVVFSDTGFRIIQASIASQHYQMYLRVQDLFEAELAAESGIVQIDHPKFVHWQGLLTYIQQVKPSVASWLPSFVPNPDLRTPSVDLAIGRDLFEGQAIVTQWQDAMGSGFAVAMEAGKVFLAKIHSNNADEAGFAHYESGQMISFMALEDGIDLDGREAGRRRPELLNFKRIS
jgi:hypothetical protein